MTETHRYSPDYVAGIVNADAREFLVSQGLPLHTSQFSAAEGGRAPSDPALLSVGTLRTLGTYYVNRDSGEIVFINGKTSARFHVNASPPQFAACIEAFDAAVIGSAYSEVDHIVDRLRAEIGGIDPTALEEDPGYWYSLFFDVANGDYSEGDEEDEDEDDDEDEDEDGS